MLGPYTRPLFTIFNPSMYARFGPHFRLVTNVFSAGTYSHKALMHGKPVDMYVTRDQMAVDSVTS